MTSQLLLKGHKMLNFLFAFSFKISETSKAHISGKETYQQTVKKIPFGFQTVSHISQQKNYQKFRCIVYCVQRRLEIARTAIEIHLFQL